MRACLFGRPIASRVVKETQNTMRVAIPEYHGRVSPVFDTCQRLLVFQMRNGSLMIPLESQDWSSLPPAVRVSRLRETGIDVLLCGGISGWLARQIEALEIQLIPWLAGDVRQVLDAFVTRKLPNRRLAMPGSWGTGHGWRFRRRGRP